MSVDLLRRAVELADAATPFVMVTMIDAIGSTPQDAGARMIVTATGLQAGTVGGGRVEAKAIEAAQAMLNDPVPCRFVDWSLKADVGMTCGGRVKLFFESHGAGGWQVAVFGAGHIAQALTRLLVTLPCQVTCLDPRSEWLDRLPAGVTKVATSNPSEEVAALGPAAFVLCMTRGHSSDFPVLKEIFASGREFPYLGVIGSKAKATVLRKELAAAGIDTARAKFHCPVGLPIGSNHPSEIAVSIVAQMLKVRDALAAEEAQP